MDIGLLYLAISGNDDSIYKKSINYIVSDFYFLEVNILTMDMAGGNTAIFSYSVETRMASRIRTVKPELFRHRDLFNLEDKLGLPVRLFWVGLFTVSDREGRFRWIPELLKLDILPYDNLNIEVILDGLWKEGLIKKYEYDSKQYGFIPTWHDHQHINHRESPSKIPGPDQQRVLAFDASTPPGIPRKFPCTPVHTRGEGKGREYI